MSKFGIGVSFFIGYLAESLTSGGSETTIYLSTLQTMTGETISTADFATLGQGEFTIDPMNSQNVESGTFTGIDGTNIALTGASRGLSALGSDYLAARAIYHPVGTLVIISFGVQTMESMFTYMKSIVTKRVSVGTSTATLTPNSTNFDIYRLTAQAATLTIANNAVTPTDGKGLIIQINDNGTAQPIFFGTQYRGMGTILPTITIANKKIILGFIWNTTDGKMDLVSINQQT
jgi:hypothetical protein